MTEIQERLQKIPGASCFACARANPFGLQLVFEPTDEGASTTFTLAEHFQSYPGFLHGGVISTIVDETMAYAGILKLNVLPFTTGLQLSYRAGVSAGRPHRCVARIVERKGRRYSAEATIGDAIVAKGEFAIPTAAMLKSMVGEKIVEAFPEFFR